MTGIKIFIIKPGILISEWITGTPGGTIPDGLVAARSSWTDVSKVTHFEFDFETQSGGDENQFKKSVIPATKKQLTPLRKTDEDRVFKSAFIGNRDVNDDAQKIMAALKYAISEWPHVAKGSGDIGKYVTLFRGTVTTSEYGGTFSALNSNGDYVWKFGTGFVRFTGLMRKFSWSEDFNNNVNIDQLLIEAGNV